MEKIDQFITSVRDACEVYLKPDTPTPDPINEDVVIASPQTIINQIFNGSVVVTAPDVSFENCTINGQNPDSAALTAYHRTKFNNGRIFGSPNGQHRGVRSDANGIRITNSIIKNIWADIDAQAVGGWDGTKDLIVDNCELEASGEVVMWGGSTLSSQDNICEDITVSNCRLTKNLEWIKKLRLEKCKNAFEVKCGRRITIKNCFIQYSWPDGGQEGYAFVITVRQDPSPWGVIEDVSILDNEVSDTAACVNILGMDDNSHNPLDPMLKNLLIRGNRFRNINSPEVSKDSTSRPFVILSGSLDTQILDNIVEGYRIGATLAFGNAKAEGVAEFLHQRMMFKGNTIPEGKYGIHGDWAPALGKAVLDMYAPGFGWDGNTVTGHNPESGIVWPKGTILVP